MTTSPDCGLSDLIARFGREVVADNILDVWLERPWRIDSVVIAEMKARLHGHPSAVDTGREGT